MSFKKPRTPIVLLFLLITAPVAFPQAQPQPEQLEMSGGAVLVGIIEAVADGKVRLQTDYAGTLEVEAARVLRVKSARSLAFAFPDGIEVIDATAAALPAAVASATPPPAAEPAKAPAPAPAKPADEDKGWVVEASLDFNQSNGNTEKMDLRGAVEAKLERTHDRLNVYSQYTYGTNRDRLTNDEIILGGNYTNFLFKRVGFFLREELEVDDFENLALRSTTASGLSWKIRQEKDLRVEARSGLSYRYENYRDDGSREFPGMDFGVDVNWRPIQWLRFKGTYTFLPSVDSLEDFIVVQDSGFDMPLDLTDRWKVRFGVNSRYNSSPDRGREKTDMRYYARLILTWQ